MWLNALKLAAWVCDLRGEGSLEIEIYECAVDDRVRSSTVSFLEQFCMIFRK